MQLSAEHQELVNFFIDRAIPAGPQYVNEHSVFLNLAGAVETQLIQLQSDVEATRKAATVMLREVKTWLTAQDISL